MNVNDRVQVDKQVQVQDFERFYLLQTKLNKNSNIIKKKFSFLFLHLIVFDKYKKLGIHAKNKSNKFIDFIFKFSYLLF